MIFFLKLVRTWSKLATKFRPFCTRALLDSVTQPRSIQYWYIIHEFLPEANRSVCYRWLSQHSRGRNTGRRCTFFAGSGTHSFARFAPLLKPFIETLLFSWPNDEWMKPWDWSGGETADDDSADAEPPEADGAVASRTDWEEVSDESLRSQTEASLLILARVAHHCKQRTTAQHRGNATMKRKDWHAFKST